MEWKSILVQSFLTFIAVIVGIRIFIPDNTQQLEALQKSISDQIQSLDSQKSESAPSQDQSSSPLTVSAGSAGTADMKEINQNIKIMSQSLEWIMESLENLEDKRTAAIPPVPQISREGDTDQRQSNLRAATNWIEDLPKDKRTEVNSIFREQAEKMKSQFKDGPPSDPKVMMEFMEKNDQELKDRMKGVRSEDEYRNFLESHPKRQRPNIKPLPTP